MIVAPDGRGADPSVPRIARRSRSSISSGSESGYGKAPGRVMAWTGPATTAAGVVVAGSGSGSGSRERNGGPARNGWPARIAGNAHPEVRARNEGSGRRDAILGGVRGVGMDGVLSRATSRDRSLDRSLGRSVGRSVASNHPHHSIRRWHSTIRSPRARTGATSRRRSPHPPSVVAQRVLRRLRPPHRSPGARRCCGVGSPRSSRMVGRHSHRTTRTTTSPVTRPVTRPQGTPRNRQRKTETVRVGGTVGHAAVGVVGVGKGRRSAPMNRPLPKHP